MCIFCDIVAGNIPGERVYEDDNVIAINDINPAAPVHILVIPKKHINNILGFGINDDKILINIFSSIKQIVHTKSLQDAGFRVVTNTGAEAGQSVDHVHFHILSGRKLNWPPG